MQEKPIIEIIPSPNELEIFHTGPALSEGPLPTFFYFALSGKDSLSLDPFNQPVAFLQGSPIRVISFNVPYHGPGFSNTKAMELWGKDFKRGNDFLTPFFEAVQKNIDYLIDQDIVDSTQMAVGGLSRGGFIATHVAARDPRINTILGYAPLTKFGTMIKYEDAGPDSMARKFDLTTTIDKIVGKRLRFYIGNRDIRVGTHLCFEFIHELAETSFQDGHRSPTVEMLVGPSIGHKGHGTSPDVFKDGVLWLQGVFGTD